MAVPAQNSKLLVRIIEELRDVLWPTLLTDSDSLHNFSRVLYIQNNPYHIKYNGEVNFFEIKDVRQARQYVEGNQFIKLYKGMEIVKMLVLRSFKEVIHLQGIDQICKNAFNGQLVQEDTSIHRMRVFKKNRKYYFRLQFTSCLNEIAWVDISKRELANYFMKQQYMFEFDVHSE